jgi:hypothetical protein
MTPIDLLQKQLNVYKVALDKSKKNFIEGKITLCLHEKHVANLEPKITCYTSALRVLRFYLDEQ